VHWSLGFSQYLDGYVKLVGPSVVALALKDYGGWGPRVESYCFFTDRDGLKIFAKNPKIFSVHSNKELQIIDGEYGASRALLNEGYSLYSVLAKHAHINWRDTRNWEYGEKSRHPTRPGMYGGLDVHPFEVMFHKKRWDLCATCERQVRPLEELRYTTWLNQGLHRRRGWRQFNSPIMRFPVKMSLNHNGGKGGLLQGAS